MICKDCKFSEAEYFVSESGKTANSRPRCKECYERAVMWSTRMSSVRDFERESLTGHTVTPLDPPSRWRVSGETRKQREHRLEG